MFSLDHKSMGNLSESLTALFRDYLSPMVPGPTVKNFLDASFDLDVQAPHLAGLIEANPLYANYLQKLDILQEKVQKWKADFPEETGTEHLTQFIAALLGNVITRGTILSIWVSRNLGSGLPRKDGVPFLLAPRNQLRCATVINDYCDERKIPNSNLAYLSALCFDCVGTVMDKKGGAIKSEKRYLDETFSEAVKVAQIAHELSGIPKNLSSSRFSFAASLLVHLGKVLMAASFPKVDAGEAWKDLLKHCEGHAANGPFALLLLEKKKYPFTHAEAAAFCALPFAWLRPAEHAIRFYQEPYLLRTSDHDSFGLGAILNASVSLAKIKQYSSLSADQKSWLKEFRILEPDVQAALARATRQKAG